MREANSRSRVSRRKHKPLFYRKWWLWLIVAILLLAGGFGIKSYVNYRHWSAPYFNKTENHVLLSDKVDKLNDDQEEAFYDIARNAIKSKESNIGFDNLKDKSLYVEKTNKKRTYHIEYVCQSDVLVKFNFRTSMNVVLKNNSLKNDNRFKFYDYKSDLTEFTSNSD